MLYPLVDICARLVEPVNTPLLSCIALERRGMVQASQPVSIDKNARAGKREDVQNAFCGMKMYATVRAFFVRKIQDVVALVPVIGVL